MNIKMDHKERLEKLYNILEFAKEEGLVPEDVFQELHNQGVILKPKVIERIVERKPKTSPETLEKLKAWRYAKKQRELEADLEKRKQLKVDKALSREKLFCFECKDMVKVLDLHHSITKKRNGKEHIILEGICSVCSEKIRQFGGYFE